MRRAWNMAVDGGERNGRIFKSESYTNEKQKMENKKDQERMVPFHVGGTYGT